MEKENNQLTRGKKNRYKNAVLHTKRDRKRQEGEARQREHDKLTIQQKINLAKSRPGKSVREITRLTKLLEKQPKNPELTKVAKEAVKVLDAQVEKKNTKLPRRQRKVKNEKTFSGR